ncbi:hypothetical protein I4U23_006014 [Adineta vaga]|nr:hypothetical protein I4U23_006014 [Adineta vaga]
MISLLENLPNEIFIHEIFTYLSIIDLNYEFFLLNERFRTLIKCFSSRKRHHLHLTRHIGIHQSIFIIDYILPFLNENHQFISLELNYVDSFLRFMNNYSQINTNYLDKIIITSFVDISFNSLIDLVFQCSQLRELKINVLTNLDSSWANGRKWNRWFENMRKHHRQNILRELDICVWCINHSDVINFDPRLWNKDGVFRDDKNWRVRLKSDQPLTWRLARRSVECSRSDEDYVALMHPKQNSTCTLI